jgi:hypothetical protein
MERSSSSRSTLVVESASRAAPHASGFEHFEAVAKRLKQRLAQRAPHHRMIVRNQHSGISRYLHAQIVSHSRDHTV